MRRSPSLRLQWTSHARTIPQSSQNDNYDDVLEWCQRLKSLKSFDDLSLDGIAAVLREDVAAYALEEFKRQLRAPDRA
jgi:hypothetical protein